MADQSSVEAYASASVKSRAFNLPYSVEEDAIMMAGITAGEMARVVAERIPARSARCIQTRMSILRRNGDAALTSERIAMSSATHGSAELCRRIMDLFARTAVTRGITLHEAARAHLAHRPTTKGA